MHSMAQSISRAPGFMGCGPMTGSSNACKWATFSWQWAVQSMRSVVPLQCARTACTVSNWPRVAVRQHSDAGPAAEPEVSSCSAVNLGRHECADGKHFCVTVMSTLAGQDQLL